MPRAAPVESRLACALSRRDEVPNVELAADLASRRDRRAIAALAALLATGSKAQQGDAIKVLYEVAVHDRALVAPHWRAIAEQLASRNNRVMWGAMYALDAVAGAVPDELAAILPAIDAAAARGSVIARDHAVGVLAQLALLPAHRRRAWPRLLAHLRDCPDLQFPMYCERAVDAAVVAGKRAFVAVLTARLPRLPRESQRRRVTRVLARL